METIGHRERVIEDLVNKIALHSTPVMNVIEDHRGRLIDLRVDQKDMKTFIGKQGNGIKALRTVIKMLYKGERTSLIIEEYETTNNHSN